MRIALLWTVAACLSAVAQAETWTGKLMDVLCRPENVEAGAKKCPHVRSCMLSPRCSESGYGLIVGEGRFYKFDPAGSAKALAALKALTSDKEVNAKVSGTLTRDVIKVETLELQ